jgi:hypothetical protein
MPGELKARIEAEAIYATWLQRGETLESLWKSPVIMETVYNRLSVREKNVLHILVTSFGSEPFDWVKLERLCLHVMSGAEAKVGFLLLLKKGLVYMFRKTWGEHVYVLAEEALSLWQQILFGCDDGRMVRLPDNSAIDGIEGTETCLASLLFQTLVYIAQNDLKLTKNGTLHKKQLQNWLELLPIDDGEFHGSALKYAFADVYPVKLAVIMEFLLRLQLIEQRGDQLCLRELAVRRWLSLSESEQNKQLYLIWKTVVFPGTAWLQHAALLLERQPEGVWLGAQGLLQWLRSHNIVPASGGGPAADNELLDQLVQQWIRPLTAFGWMETAVSRAEGEAAGCYRWRMHPLVPSVSLSEETDERFYVQPDFEILVPPDVPYTVRWELSFIADRLKSDQVSVYKLSKESLQRGLENGRKLKDSLEFLERYALYGIPDNVRLTLEQWAKPFGKVQLAEVLLLRCEDSEVAEAVRKLPGSADCLVEELGERAWIIRADRLKKLTELLDKAGWMPGKMTLLGDSSLPGTRNESSPDLISLEESKGHSGEFQSNGELPLADKGFLYSRHTFIYFEMEQKIPDIRDLYPDLQGVPQGWMKDYRTYHASTRREMVEKAMEWKTALQVRHNGRDQVIAPRKLQETRGSWSMTGLEQSNLQEVCLFPDDWQEMKIIVPGINDKY